MADNLARTVLSFIGRREVRRCRIAKGSCLLRTIREVKKDSDTGRKKIVERIETPREGALRIASDERKSGFTTNVIASA